MFPLTLARKIGLGKFAQKIARLMPGPLANMAQIGPSEPAQNAINMFTPARGVHRGSVVLLRGCVGSVVSGALEASSVDPVHTMVDMIASLRAYESGQKMISSIDETMQQSAQSVGAL